MIRLEDAVRRGDREAAIREAREAAAQIAKQVELARAIASQIKYYYNYNKIVLLSFLLSFERDQQSICLSIVFMYLCIYIYT